MKVKTSNIVRIFDSRFFCYSSFQRVLIKSTETHVMILRSLCQQYFYRTVLYPFSCPLCYTLFKHQGIYCATDKIRFYTLYHFISHCKTLNLTISVILIAFSSVCLVLYAQCYDLLNSVTVKLIVRVVAYSLFSG